MVAGRGRPLNPIVDRIARHPALVAWAFRLGTPREVDLDPVTWGLRWVLPPWLGRATTLAEVGTGPAALLATWMCRSTGRAVDAIELDPARAAAARASAPPGVRVRLGDGPRALPGPVDLLVFNPPYLPSASAVSALPRRVWDGGADGTEVLGRWLEEAAALPARRVVFGVGARWVRVDAVLARFGTGWTTRARHRTPGARLWVLELTRG